MNVIPLISRQSGLANMLATMRASIKLDKPVRTFTDHHREECREALDDITVRFRVERAKKRWDKDRLSKLREQRKILQTHINKLDAGVDIETGYLHQVDADLEAYRTSVV